MTTFGSLFSGIGGSSIGAMQYGLDVKFAVDSNPALAAMYSNNLGLSSSVQDVVTFIPPVYRIDVLQASPPCVNFSGLNIGSDGEDKNDSMLSAAILFAIDYCKPSYVVIENVAKYASSKAFEHLRKGCEKRGYNYGDGCLIDASYLGVPQTRKRFIWVATLDDSYLKVVPPVNKRQDCWGSHFDDSKLLRWVNKIVKPTDKQLEAIIAAKLPPTALIPRVGYHSLPKVYAPDRPIGTIAAHLADDGKGHSRPCYNLLHDKKFYDLSIYAAGVLSGMPHDYQYSGKGADDWRGLGNIMHPAVMRYVLECLEVNQ